MRRRFIINIRNNTPNREIWYTSTDGLVVSPHSTKVFNAVILNNVYDTKNNVGKITFNKIVTTIGEEAFGGCDSLESVTIPDSVTTIGNKAFIYCSSLTSITIPDSVTSIGSRAFSNCDSLTSVTIGDSVTEIEDYAFFSCYSLTSVYCKATTPPALNGSSVFDSNGSGRKIYVPYQSLDAYKTAEYWSEYADDIVGYDFENDVVIITFYIGIAQYQSEEGMTWEEWCNSEYNDGVRPFIIMSNKYVVNSEYLNVQLNGSNVVSTDIIISASYTIDTTIGGQ